MRCRSQAGALCRALYSARFTGASKPYIRPVGLECRAAFSTAFKQALVSTKDVDGEMDGRAKRESAMLLITIN
jgi:hypothetical protein